MGEIIPHKVFVPGYFAPISLINVKEKKSWQVRIKILKLRGHKHALYDD